MIEKLNIVLKCGFDFAFPIVLYPGLPLIRDQPPSDEVIIVSIELELAPAFSLKAIEEQGALQYLGPERTCASGHAGCATINVVGRGDLEVSSLNICSSQPIEQKFGNGTRSDSLDSLTGAYTTNLCVFKGSKEPGYDCPRPRDIVVCHDNDVSLDLGNSLTNLNTLVRNWDVENTNIRCFQRLHKCEKPLIFVRSCDQEKFVGMAREYTLKRLLQFLKVIMDRRDDDGDIFGSKGWFSRY